ncbi:MAG TPA: alpha/beta fold hydrolase [Pseudolabrys sp.]|nr:alpha/beta fold hydrolase [Pseudolabrys sp.]
MNAPQLPQDAKLKAATTHWAHRFITNGVILADFQDITSALGHWDEWCAAWAKRAGLHEAMGREALAKGQHVSAAEHLTRAGVYYHFGKFLFVHDLPQMRDAHRKAVECRRLALPHLDPPGERVEIPYEGKHLAATLRRPRGAARPPVVIMAMGLDSAKEEMDSCERTFLDRGMATLCFDGPGQGEAEYDFGIRGDYEVVVTAVVDWLQSRRDLDLDRIGLWGVSLGGYYAPRAAAFEKRIKACISLSGPYDFADCWDALPDLTRLAFKVRSKSTSDEDARRKAGTLSLASAAKKITCPLLIATGKLDRVIPWDHSERLAREAKGPVELILVEDGTHVANNRPHRYRPQSADWMAAQLR